MTTTLGRNPYHNNGRKTHCPQGHEYSPENTVYTPNGWRRCIACRSTGVGVQRTVISRRLPQDIEAWDALRFLTMIRIGELNECWLWQGALNDNGYGQFSITRDGKQCKTVAHSFMYQFIVGPIPDGLQLDHLCMVRACCNPLHLEPVTQSVNLRRAAAARAVSSSGDAAAQRCFGSQSPVAALTRGRR